MDFLRTKSHLNTKYMKLPKEKIILHVCLTFCIITHQDHALEGTSVNCKENQS